MSAHREESQPSRITPWSPGRQAQSEQEHAAAVDLLRQADIYFLVTANEMGCDDGGEQRYSMTVGGGGFAEPEVHRLLLRLAVAESTRALLRLMPVEEADDE